MRLMNVFQYYSDIKNDIKKNSIYTKLLKNCIYEKKINLNKLLPMVLEDNDETYITISDCIKMIKILSENDLTFNILIIDIQQCLLTNGIIVKFVLKY